jgi:hypothetical protein
MEIDKLSTGEKISAASAILLFIFMFFDWFGAKVEGFTGALEAGGSAWDALDVIPIFLMIAIIAAIGVAVVRLTDADLEPAVSLNTIVAALGALAVILILYRIVNPPGDDSIAGVSIDITLKIGIFLSLASAIGIAYGGYSAMREEGVTFGDAADRLSGGPGAGPGPGGGPGGSQTPPPPPSAQTPPPPPGSQTPPPGSQSPPPPPPPAG